MIDARGRQRTLIRVVTVGQRGIGVCIPGWDPKKVVPLFRSDFPEELRDKLEPGQCFLANVDLGAIDPAALNVSRVELAPEEPIQKK